MRLAVVGATGMVGTQIFRVLEELDFQFDELVPVASERSIGRTITCKLIRLTLRIALQM